MSAAMTAVKEKAERPRVLPKEEVAKRITRYLAAHCYLRLATVTPDGRPLAHAVQYVAEGNTIYFMTFGTTRKVQNIKNNPNVAYTVDENSDRLRSIQGVQIEGTAALVEDRREAARIMSVFLREFPELSDYRPGSNYLVVVKVVPRTGYFIDYTGGLPGRYKVEL